MHLMPVILSHIFNNCVAINETITVTETQADKERDDNTTSINEQGSCFVSSEALTPPDLTL